MTITTILTPFPPPPTPMDTPEQFNTKAFDSLIAQGTLVSEVNQLVPEINQTVQAINVSTANAAESEQSAWDAAALAGQKLQLATAQADVSIAQALIATDKATTASNALESITVLIDLFGDKYLGPHAADPLTDNDGDPLQVGAVYLNTSTGVLRFYASLGWVQGISVVAGVSALNGLAGDLALKTINGTALTGAGDIAINVNAVIGLAQVIDELTQALSAKAEQSHSHQTSEITGLNEAIAANSISKNFLYFIGG